MNTERFQRRRQGAPALLAACALAATQTMAQAPARPGERATAAPILSSPISTPGSGGAPPIGSGPGVHDPRSAFKPLQEREGVVSWKLLSSVTARVEKDRVIPSFPSGVRALNAQPVKVQGFMMPLEPGERQRHFLLSAVPTTCNFCVPAGPEGLVEVRTKEPIRYTVEAITVAGKFAVLSDDKYGIFYRVADAAQVD
jgi:uncharacterized protein